MSAREWIALAAFLALSYGVAWIGGRATDVGVSDWYPTLAKPAWTPPGALIGAVWAVLYALIGLAGWLAWREVGLDPRTFAAFGLQLALNASWSAVFFGARRPGAAFAVIVALWLAILLTALLLARARPLAGWLFAPYLAWVTFAGALNFRIWTLNR